MANQIVSHTYTERQSKPTVAAALCLIDDPKGAILCFCFLRWHGRIG
jgi:hypothetical protein